MNDSRTDKQISHKNAGKKAYIISHTHWDREWRYPIWQTRQDLERLFSNLLKLLENDPRYRSFVTDSQSVIIEDYLQICPQDRPRIKKLVEAGRIQIGPWYTLPEYYPVDGECIVRNLLIGDRVCKQYGGAMKIGYTTFGWGQPGQMPQIYENFGIDVALGGKNVAATRTRYNEFIWEGVDGTRILASKLGVQGRANFFKFVVIPVVFGKENIGDNWSFDWDSRGVVYHNADAANYWQDYHRVYRNEQDCFDPARVKAAVENVLKTVEGTALPEHTVFFDGGDFTFAQPMLCDIIEQANTLFEDIEFVHCGLDEYVNMLKVHVDTERLDTVKGEWRDGPEPAVSANALAFRSDLKHANKAAQRAIIHCSEPISTVSELLGGRSGRRYLDLAWDYLLKSHCHDSLHGVVQDKTARDTAYRIEQVKELADGVTDSSLRYIIRNIKFDAEQQGIALVLFNPLPFERREIVRAVIDTPRDWNARELTLIDPEHNEVAAELISIEPVKVAVNEEDSRPWPYHAHRHVVEFDAGVIPATGYKSFTVKVKTTLDDSIASWPLPPMKRRSLFNGPGILENEFLRLSLNPNGTFDLYDKENRREYKSLHYFEDSGDAGCGWIRYEPSENRTYTSLTAGAVESWIAGDTEYAGTLAVKTTLNLPIACDKKAGEFDLYASQRWTTTRPFEILSEITLKRNSKRVEITTSFENTVTHHRLRVMFPTYLKDALYADAEGHFIVDRKPIEPVRDGEGRFRPGMCTQPHQYFVDVSDGKSGLMLLNDGLCEYEVAHDESRTIALSLLRSVKMRICTEPRVGSEYPTQNSWFGLGRHKFSYSVCPHAGDWQNAGAYQQARTFTVPLKVVQTNTHRFGTLPLKHSFFSIEGDAQLSCLKKAQDGSTVIIRLYNPSEKTIDARVRCSFDISAAYLVDMNEQRLETLKHEVRSVSLQFGPAKIKTLELEFAGLL